MVLSVLTKHEHFSVEFKVYRQDKKGKYCNEVNSLSDTR